MPAGGMLGVGIAGLVLSAYQAYKNSKDRDKVQGQLQQGSAAELAELRRKTELAKKLEEIFGQGIMTAGDAWSPGMVGSEGPQSQDAFANLIRGNATKGLMGLTGTTGTGLTQQLGSQSFLEGQQDYQDVVGNAEALAQTILDKYGNKDDPIETKRIADLGSAPQTSGAGIPWDVRTGADTSGPGF